MWPSKQDIQLSRFLELQQIIVPSNMMFTDENLRHASCATGGTSKCPLYGKVVLEAPFAEHHTFSSKELLRLHACTAPTIRPDDDVGLVAPRHEVWPCCSRFNIGVSRGIAAVGFIGKKRASTLHATRYGSQTTPRRTLCIRSTPRLHGAD